MSQPIDHTHEHFMEAALQEAQLALDEGEFPVGCIFVCNGEIIARGRRENSAEHSRNEIDHAEIKTLRQFIRQEHPVDISQVHVYTTLEPCLMCYSTLLLSGIRTFIWACEDVMGGGTNLPLHMLNPLYAEMQVTLIDRVKRGKSLRLLQQFFIDYSYWQDSPLSRYILEQK